MMTLSAPQLYFLCQQILQIFNSISIVCALLLQLHLNKILEDFLSILHESQCYKSI